MRIHPVTRQIVHGIGGEGAYLDGAALAAGGGQNGMPDWLGDSPIWCGVTGKPFQFLRGSHAGAWAGWTSQGGVVTSWGLVLPAAVLLDMAPDGTLLVGDDYQSGVGISAYSQTGRIWRVATAKPALFFPYAQAAILDAQTACWTEDRNGRRVLVGFGLPEGPRPPWNILHTRLLRVNGEVWVVYLRGEDDRIIAHPWDYRGLGFSVPGFGFGPDAWSDGTTLTMCWSVGAGELPADIKRQTFDLAELEDIPSVAVPVVTPIAPNASAKLVAGAWGTTPETPGNLSLGPDPSKAVICTVGESAQVDPDRLMALFVSETDAARDRQAANDLKVPLAIYVDDRDYLARLPGILAAVGDTPWIAILQCYIDRRVDAKDASLDSFAAEVLAQASRLPVPWIAAVRCTTPSVDGVVVIPVERVIAAMNRLVPIVADPNCLGWALFKWKRGDGVTGVPALLPAAQAWLTGTPTLQPNDARAWAKGFYETETTVESVRLSPDEAASVQRFVSVYPLASGHFHDEDAVEKWLDTAYRNPPDGLMFKLAQYMCFRHGPKWGHKRRSNGAPRSAGSIAYRISDGVEVEPGIFKADMHVFDMLIGVASGQPRLDTGVESLVVQDGQEWIRVEPVDHVGGLVPTPGRTKLPGKSIRVSSFDLPALIGSTDPSLVTLGNRWMQEVVIKYGLIPRMFTYANGRGGVRHWRDAATGLRQAEKTMQQMLLLGLSGSWVVVCGTGPEHDNWSEEQSYDYLRQFNALALKYPTAIHDIQGGNELTHGIEAGYFSTRRFWQFADDHIIDKRFPFTYGAGHGGESVSYMGGSHLVHHADRSRTPDENGAIMAVARAAGWDIGDDEAMGICEVGQINGRQRVDTADFMRQQLAAMKKYDLTFVTAHIDAGLTCNVDMIGPVQTEVLSLCREAKQALGGSVPTPGTTDHPILDVNLIQGGNNEALSNPGYTLIVDQWDALVTEAKAWFKRAEKRDPTPGELRMMINIRLVAERYRWVTPRAAWTNAWPTGAPTA